MIKKIHYKLNFNAEVGNQPTIHVMCDAEAHIYFNDGRIFEDIKIDWDNEPYLKDPNKFTVEETIEINNILNNNEKGLWLAVESKAVDISNKSIIKTINME